MPEAIEESQTLRIDWNKPNNWFAIDRGRETKESEWRERESPDRKGGIKNSQHSAERFKKETYGCIETCGAQDSSFHLSNIESGQD